MPFSNKRRKPSLLRHAGLQEFMLFEPFLILSKDPDLRDRASTSLRRHGLIAGQTADSSVAVGSEKPTTPCKCCTSITGRWWIWRRRRGTGRSAPRVYCRALGLAAENLVKAAEEQQCRISQLFEAYHPAVTPKNRSIAMPFLVTQKPAASVETRQNCDVKKFCNCVSTS
jgi:hypothetical protein